MPEEGFISMTALRLYPFAAITVAAALLLAACGGDGDKQPATGTPATPPSAAETPTLDETLPAVVATRQDLAARLEQAPEDVQVVSVTPTEWPDACLGAGEEDEVCAEVITPGYEVVLRLNETQYTYRTDQTGANVRFAGVDVGAGD